MQVTLFAPVAKGGRDEALSVVKEQESLSRYRRSLARILLNAQKCCG